MRGLGFLAVAVLFYACSGGATSGTHTPSALTPTSSPSADLSSKTPPAPDAQGSPGSESTQALLEGALLQAAELPAGWISGRIQEPQLTSNICDQELDEGTPTARAHVAMINSDNGFLESIALYSSEQAHTLVDNVRAAFSACVEWPRPLSGGIATYDPSPLAVAQIGDDTVAFRVAVVLSNKKGTNDFVVVRRANLVMVLSYLTANTGDTSETNALLEKADGKLVSLQESLGQQ